MDRISTGSIPDVKVALETGTIPAIIKDDEIEFPLVEYLNTRGKKLFHQLKIKLMNENDEFVPILTTYLAPKYKLDKYKALLYTISGQDNVRESTPTQISEGKNIGKKNETNCLSQAVKEAYSKYMKQLEKTAHVSTVETKDSIKVTPPPMLASVYGRTKLDKFTSYDAITVQYKRDGVRCVYCIIDGKPYAYSRTSKPFVGLTILNQQIEAIYNDKDFIKLTSGLSSPLYFDGELYNHTLNLNDITSIVGTESERDTSAIHYYVFDVFTLDGKMVSQERQALLDNIFKLPVVGGLDHLHRVDNYKIANEDELHSLFSKALSENYEGLIIRKDYEPYQFSFNHVHSHHLLKYKKVQDGEFAIVGFDSAKQGSQKGAIIWICTTESGNTFSVVPNGSIEDRKKLFTNLKENPDLFEKYKGKMLTVQYSELNYDTGIPQQPKGKVIRDYE